MLPALALAAYATVAAVDPAPDHLDVSPPQVEIGPERRWQDLSIRNGSGVPRLVRATPYAWTHDDSGTMLLAPAGDLAVFPATLTLGPGESRRVRVHVPTPPPGPGPASERAYRVALDVSTGADDALRVLVPVFVIPGSPVERPALSVACERTRVCRIAVHNRGNARLRLDPLVLSVRTRAGAEEERTLEPSWVLAGRRRVWVVSVPELEDGAQVSVRGRSAAGTIDAAASDPELAVRSAR